MKVFMVEVGSYSSTEIVAAFSDEGEAERVASLMGGHVLEPLKVDNFYAEEPPAGKEFWEIHMGKDGKVIQSYLRPVLDDGQLTGTAGKLREERIWFRTHKDSPWERKSYWRLYVEKYVASREEAVKIADGLRRKILAGERPEGVDLGEN